MRERETGGGLDPAQAHPGVARGSLRGVVDKARPELRRHDVHRVDLQGGHNRGCRACPQAELGGCRPEGGDAPNIVRTDFRRVME